MSASTKGFHDRVTVTIEDHVADVRLDRPEKMNALDQAMFNGIHAAGAYLAEVRGVRCVVLSGNGRAFCAGMDLGSLNNTNRWRDTPITARTHGNSNASQQATTVWRKLPMPVIGAVHGVCFGGGLQIACAPDIRFVTPDARLSVMEVKWGLIPDMAGFSLWRGVVRDDILRELTYSQRQFNGMEAVAFGFATHVDADPFTRALELARVIASKSPDAIRQAKAMANRMLDMSGDEILFAESEASRALMYSDNQREAVAASIAKREAVFIDP